MRFDADYTGVASPMQFGVPTARGRARAQSRLRCMDWILIFAIISPNANTSRFEKRNANRIRFIRYGLIPKKSHGKRPGATFVSTLNWTLVKRRPYPYGFAGIIKAAGPRTRSHIA